LLKRRAFGIKLFHRSSIQYIQQLAKKEYAETYPEKNKDIVIPFPFGLIITNEPDTLDVCKFLIRYQGKPILDDLQ